MFRRISVRWKLAIGSAGIVVSTIMIALFAGWIPDEQTLVANGRAQLCESIAIYNSALLVEGETHAIETALTVLADHNPDIQSIGVRRQAGPLIVDIGDHSTHWRSTHNAASAVNQIKVPLVSDEEQWGTVEVAFRPVVGEGLIGTLNQTVVRLPVTLGFLSCLMFWFYLGRMLNQLDPSTAVPGRVREALDGLAESLIVIDNKGVVRFANRVLADLVGLPREKVMGRSIHLLPWVELQEGKTNTDEQADIQMPWAASLHEGKATVGEMLELIAGNGSLRTLNISCSPILGPNGVSQGVMICGDDVTHLEEIKHELRRAKEQADAASAAKSAFVANMSHEIRTPLNAVLGFADVLRRGMAESREEEVEYLDMIHRSGQHLLELINDILDLSKIESGGIQIEMVDCPVYQSLNDVTSFLRQRAQEQGLTLTTELETAIPESIQNDPTKFRQIIANLTGNAIKFTESGSVTIRARLTQGRRPFIEIDVCDTGIGMTAEQQKRVFQAFQQADESTTRKFGGTGLGLAISKQFAEAMGGTLTLTSETGKGSTFTLRLPAGDLKTLNLVSPETILAQWKQHDQQQMEGKSIRLPAVPVLVVDDGEANRRLLELVLSRVGADVTVACDGVEALRELSKCPFELVFMDMQMPGLDGYQATEMIRSTGCETPIIALTGNAMKGDRQRCLAAGCTDFLSKPVNVDVLLETAARYLAPHSGSTGSLAAVTHGSERRTEQSLPVIAESRVLEQIDTIDQLCDLSPSPVHSPQPSALSTVTSTLPMDDPEFRKIVSDFIPRMKERIATMRHRLNAACWDELSEDAHWLKGSAGTTGLGPLVEPAARLQHAAEQRQSEACGRLLQEIEQLARRVEDPARTDQVESMPTASLDNATSSPPCAAGIAGERAGCEV